MSWGAANFGQDRWKGQVALDMKITAEEAERLWYELADAECTYGPRITAYRERFEALKLQEESGKPAPQIFYLPEAGSEAATESGPELRLAPVEPPKASPFVQIHPAAPLAKALVLRVVPKPTAVPTPAPHPATIAMPNRRQPAIPPAEQAAIATRLKQARVATGWWTSAIESELLIPPGTLYAVECGRVTKWIPEICVFLKINEAWLKTGEGDMHSAPPPAPPKKAGLRGCAPRQPKAAKVKPPAPAGPDPKVGYIPPSPDPVPPPAVEPIEPAPRPAHTAAVALTTLAELTPPPQPIPAPLAEMQTAKLLLEFPGSRFVAVTAPTVLSPSEMERVQKWFALQFLVA